MMLGLRKGLRPDKKNNSAYNCNCKVAHNMGLHRGLLAVDLEDENQWNELAKQPKIAGTDIRYSDHSIIQPVVPRYINHHHPYQRTYRPANQQQPVHHHRQNLWRRLANCFSMWDTIKTLIKTRKSRNKMVHNKKYYNVAHYKKWTQNRLKSAKATINTSSPRPWQQDQKLRRNCDRIFNT